MGLYDKEKHATKIIKEIKERKAKCKAFRSNMKNNLNIHILYNRIMGFNEDGEDVSFENNRHNRY